MEGGIYSTAPGEVVLLMTLSPSSPSGKEPSSMLIYKPTTKAEWKLMGLAHQAVTNIRSHSKTQSPEQSIAADYTRDGACTCRKAVALSNKLRNC